MSFRNVGEREDGFGNVNQRPSKRDGTINGKRVRHLSLSDLRSEDVNAQSVNDVFVKLTRCSSESDLVTGKKAHKYEVEDRRELEIGEAEHQLDLAEFRTRLQKLRSSNAEATDFGMLHEQVKGLGLLIEQENAKIIREMNKNKTGFRGFIIKLRDVLGKLKITKIHDKISQRLSKGGALDDEEHIDYKVLSKACFELLETPLDLDCEGKSEEHLEEKIKDLRSELDERRYMLLDLAKYKKQGVQSWVRALVKKFDL